jgi:hypothetical protein
MIFRSALLIGLLLLFFGLEGMAQAQPRWLIWGNFTGDVRIANSELPELQMDAQLALGHFIGPRWALGMVGRLNTEPRISHLSSIYKRGELYGGVGAWGRYFLPLSFQWRPYLQLMPWVEHRRIWGFSQPPQGGVDRIDYDENIPFVRMEGGVMLPLNSVLNLDLSLGWQTPLAASAFDVAAGWTFRVGLTGLIYAVSSQN